MKSLLIRPLGLRVSVLAVIFSPFAALAAQSPAPDSTGPVLLSTNGGKSTAQSVKQLEAAVKKGDVKAKAQLGEMILRGQASDAKPDYARALTLLDEAARAGDGNAAFRVGMTFVDGDIVEADPTRAVAYLRGGAVGGVAEAFHNVGVAYSTGKGVKKDYVEALAWLMLAKKHGTDGTVEQDLRKFLTRQRRTNDIQAGEKRATELERELAQTTVAKNLPPAAPFKIKDIPDAPAPAAPTAAVGGGDGGVKIGAVATVSGSASTRSSAATTPSARTSSGPPPSAPSLAPPPMPLPGAALAPSLPSSGDAGPEVKLVAPTGRTLSWPSVAALEREAEKGGADALAGLGQALLDGKIMPEDAKRAAEVLEHAAKAGSADAAQLLADLYTRGTRIPKDDTKAFNYTLQAAKGGVITATFNLGALYANGRGTPVNYAEALTWMTVAKYFNRDTGSQMQIRSYLQSTHPEQVAPAEKRAQEQIAALEKIRRDNGL